jgi:hypothetical protein
MGEVVLARGGFATVIAIILFISGAWTFDNFGNRDESTASPTLTFKPAPTYTVQVPVKETVLRDETYSVRLPVTKTVFEDETYKVQKAVPYTEYRDEVVKRYKPVYYTVMERREVTVPTLSPVQVYVDGYWTTEWRYVDTIQTRLTPVRKRRMKLVESVRKVPFESIRYVEEERTRKVPVERTVYVEEQKTRQVPEERIRYVEEQRNLYAAADNGSHDPAPAL